MFHSTVLPPSNSSQFSFSISATSSSLNTINQLTSFASYCGVVLIADILISSNAMKLSGGLIVRHGRPVSIFDPCALQKRFSFGLWTTTASPHRTWRVWAVSAFWWTNRERRVRHTSQQNPNLQSTFRLWGPNDILEF